MNTDYSDCRHLRSGEDDSCRWARDGECDEPNFGTGACTQGTDHTDCGDIASLRNETDSCATAFNGVCEEPGHGNGSCAPRTDRSDCLGRNRPMNIADSFFGHDDRILVPVGEAPWRFVGNLVIDGTACTAVLVGRDIIATAANCIFTNHGLRVHGTFTSANGQQAFIVAYLYDHRFNYNRFLADNDQDGRNWALLRLDHPLGDESGFAGVQALNDGAAPVTVMQAGYAWDTGRNLAGMPACQIVAMLRDNTLVHQCDTTRGDSGAPFFVRNGSGFDVVGVDSNYRRVPGAYINIAVSAASFSDQIAGFAAGTTGTMVTPRH
jgi:protease YdgD